MREKLIVVLLSVCCTLLVVNLIALWSDKSAVVHGQTAGIGGEYIVATSATQNDPICFIFKPSSQHLVAYMARTNGIRVMGVRHAQWDFNHTEIKSHFSVSNAKKATK